MKPSGFTHRKTRLQTRTSATETESLPAWIKKPNAYNSRSKLTYVQKRALQASVKRGASSIDGNAEICGQQLEDSGSKEAQHVEETDGQNIFENA